MKLSSHEKQILAGSLVIGMLLGAFGAYAVFAFASESVLQGTDASNRVRTAVEAFVVFWSAVFGTFAVLGVLPIAVRRMRAKKGPVISNRSFKAKTHMYLFRTAPLVKQLGAKQVSPQLLAEYLLASFVVFNLFYYAAIVVPSADPWTVISLLEGAAIVVITMLGVVRAFDSSGGKRNPDFVAEFTCLYVPVTITTASVLWGGYWLIVLGFREALNSATFVNSRFAINLFSLGFDIFSFLAFAANVGVTAVTYVRINTLLAQVRALKGNA